MPENVLGIFREVLHSPEREFDDSEILRLVGKSLSGRGLNVVLKSPEEVMRESGVREIFRPGLVFIMCEQEKILDLLGGWEKDGAAVVNSTESILNTYRHRMTPLLQAAGVHIPKSDLVRTAGPVGSARGKVWIKRGDVHNTQKGDVSLAGSAEEIDRALKFLGSRGIRQAVIQEHVEGDLIKFYGIGNPGDDGRNFWFRWFYHRGQDLKKYAFSEGSLRNSVCSAASCLGLEIFGGDAIAAKDGRIFLIDINAWPSFALFRREASRVISEYLLSKIHSPTC
jgi:hypothetical protein